MGLPIMTMELSVGRGSQRSIASSFDVLEKTGQKWHWLKFMGIAGNYLLMMFYTTISGWMLIYFFKYASGSISAYKTAEELGGVFGNVVSDTGLMTVATFAAFSTVIAVFENIMSFWLELTNMKRGKVAIINIILIALLSLPCILGFTVWSDFSIAGKGIMDLEDFTVSNILLPLGSLFYVLFCTTRYGWGWDNYFAEVNAGKGLKLAKWLRPYLSYILPIALFIVFLVSVFKKRPNALAFGLFFYFSQQKSMNLLQAKER